MNNNNLVILTNFNNNLMKYRNETSPIKKSDFPTSGHYKEWSRISERILNAGYTMRIAAREGSEPSESEKYYFDLAFEVLVRRYFGAQSIILGDLETLKREILSHVCDVKKDRETPEEGRIPIIKGERAFRKALEILLADRIVGKKYRTLEESLRLKEERAARRKAKREAAKAAKKAAAEAEAKAREEAEIVNVEILTLPNKI